MSQRNPVNSSRPDPTQRIEGAGLRIQAVGRTDVGRERTVNEDAMFYDNRLGLFLVCDGMGGHASGQLASQLAIYAMAESVRLAAGKQNEKEPLITGILAANEAVLQRAAKDPHCQGMGTTVVGLRLDGTKAHVCHVGDSRAYVFRGGQLRQLTRDHSLKNLYAEQPELEGKLGPATANVIVRAIGLEPSVKVDHQVLELMEHDQVLLCCDGLTDLVPEQTIHEALASDRPRLEVASELVEAANHNGGSDNITVVIATVEAGSPNDFADDGLTRPGF